MSPFLRWYGLSWFAGAPGLCMSFCRLGQQGARGRSWRTTCFLCGRIWVWRICSCRLTDKSIGHSGVEAMWLAAICSDENKDGAPKDGTQLEQCGKRRIIRWSKNIKSYFQSFRIAWTRNLKLCNTYVQLIYCLIYLCLWKEGAMKFERDII